MSKGISNGQANIDTQISISPTHVEPGTCNALLGTQENARLVTLRYVSVHSRRKRLCDPDNICAKAVIDGLVRGGILTDDTTKEIKEVRFSQEKSKTEETIIEIRET